MIKFFPSLSFAKLMDRQTEGKLAAAEALLNSSIRDIIYVIVFGWPLTNVGTRGWESLLLAMTYSLEAQFDAKYFPFLFWIYTWVGSSCWGYTRPNGPGSPSLHFKSILRPNKFKSHNVCTPGIGENST